MTHAAKATLPARIVDIDGRLLRAAAAHSELFERQLASSEPHETDFLAFKLLRNPNCIVLDVGANIGNSALSIHSVRPSWSVYSFEPNLALAPFLDRVATTFEADRSTFRWFPVGLGNEAAELPFYVPTIDDWFVIGEASFNLEHFQHPVVRKRLSSYSKGGLWHLSRARFSVVRFDDYQPIQSILTSLRGNEGLIVKMDVEGFEEAAIFGMTRFIAQRRPIFLVENDPMDRIPELLGRHGYATYGYDPAINRLKPIASREGYLNLFYLTHELAQSGVMAGTAA